MPLDTLGRTRATMVCAESLFDIRPKRTASFGVFGRRQRLLGASDWKVTLVLYGLRETLAEKSGQSKIHAVIWDWGLQLLSMNEEFPVSAIHHIALITSLPFVHTARRYYRLNGSVRPSDWLQGVGNDPPEPESWSNPVI